MTAAPWVPLLLCALPAERSALCGAILALGATPLVDLTTGSGAVPDGAWVRVRAGDPVPGTGPVVQVGGSTPVPGRPTWLERTRPEAPPAGFAGILLRGAEAGGPCASAPGLTLLAQVPAGVPVILEAGLIPDSLTLAAKAHGVVLSDVLLGLAELDLPKQLRHRVELADPAGSHVVNGFRLQASPFAPVLRQLLDGASFWDKAKGHWAADDLREHAWPAGTALVHASRLAAAYGDLAGLIGAYQAAAQHSAPRPARDVVAIIGLGCRLPGANSVDEFWDNLLQGRSSIVDVPPSRWDPALFWDADHDAVDKTYARIGGFITDFQFNPRRFRIPPAVASSVDPVQQTALESAADALLDAGYKAGPKDEGREFDRSRTAVILGNSMGGEVTDDYVMRVRVPAVQRALDSVPDFARLPAAAREAILKDLEVAIKADLPPITEDSMPGELSNVTAGRVANALDLSGANFTVDAACASSLAALQTAVKGLLDGDFDMALSGGSDRSMAVSTYTKFCRIGALSADHSAPFDATANGFVMGEGCGVLVLKRLSDAERDGDRIYAVIRGIGASSDGKGKGITAPNPVGQRLALSRAYADAGLDPVEVDLIEAHGTSTVVGDKVEVEALTEVIGAGRRGDRGPIRLGSVKSNIGHLKSAAGAASLIKVSLALHHAVLPPSLNFKTARTDVPFDAIPLQVQTIAEAWPADRIRRAGVSAFGFGGTNFHVVLEQHRPGQPLTRSAEGATAAAAAPAALGTTATPTAVPKGLWALSSDHKTELLDHLEGLRQQGTLPGRSFEAAAAMRLVFYAESEEEREAQLDRALKVLEKDGSPDLLRARNIAFEDEPCDGKLAFLFTGQGSQYLDMGLDLAEQYPIVAQTFAEADAVMVPELGRPLMDFIRRDPSMDEAEQFDRLRATEISQPATLTIDVAILRLLAAYGVRPDMVAGHSLGEYAAAVAAGMLSFEDALVAVSARGREMASVRIADPGRMAGVASSVATVQQVLAEIPGYIVAANKNCPTQTVIAGESDAVEAATEAFRSRGITVYPLPVSHAFHSRIVAPASAPLRKVLERLNLQAPRRPVTTNVTSSYYPTGEGAREQAIDILARQVASPVEWIAQMERMYSDGARIFVECGPKRALSGFVASVFKRRPHRALYTNHPKRGGVASFMDALAALTALGFPVREVADTGPVDIFAESDPRRSTTVAMQVRATGHGQAVEASAEVQSQVIELVAELTGYDSDEIRPEDELEADLGIDTVKQAELVARIRDRLKLDHDPDFRLSEYRSLQDLARYAAGRLGALRTRPTLPAPARSVALAPSPSRQPARQTSGLNLQLPHDAIQALVAGAVQGGLTGQDADAVARAVAPALHGLLSALVNAVQAAQPSAPAPAPAAAPVSAPVAAPVSAPVAAPTARPQRALPQAQSAVVCTGVSVGLPGGTELFDPNNIRSILAGENRIEPIAEQVQDAILGQNVVRLHKDPQTGQGTFAPVTEREEVIKLAGIRRKLDLEQDYGIDPGLLEALDITTKMAFAAGLEALNDAGIPLVRRYRETRTGKRVPTGWALPEALRDGTGVIFASAFPGYTQLIDQLTERMRDRGPDESPPAFDRRFLFQVLSMGHSQFAQLVGARGPNTQINAACASTTQAIGLAQDWIRCGRAERVVIVGADDVTNDTMLPWFGAGFLAAGAATTEADVTQAALPFDRRRHGMIMGSGAVGLVLEKEADVVGRGCVPLARLLATRMANSAFHGTRLDPEHIAGEVDALVAEATANAGVDRARFARSAVFMSHETYTPAKGGSAAAEIESLRHAFGAEAKHIVVANTKGFTGHPMAAGIEDGIVLKAMQYSIVPPVPNLREPDPDLGELTLSKGGAWGGRYALRLAAGFGSQVALAAWEKLAEGDLRVVDAGKRDDWLHRISGLANAHLAVEQRTLRLIEDDSLEPIVSEAPPVEAAAPAPAPAPGPAASADPSAVLPILLGIIAEKTGYDTDELDPEYELEADLGIDTVKQAEIFSEVREKLGVEQDPEFRLADTPTIQALAAWLAGRMGAAAPTAASAPAPAPAFAPVVSAQTADSGQVLAVLTAIIAEKTGYDTDELDPEYELEADLGIDTVKQAEIFSEVREKLGVEQDPEFRLADTPTIQALAAWLAGRMAPAAPTAASAPALAPAPAPAPVQVAAPAASADSAQVLAVLTAIIAEKTGYDTDELDPEYELEADLGIDTVKQAEIFSEVREKLGVEQDPEFRLADTPTIQALAAWLTGRMVADQAPAAADAAEAPDPTDPPPAPRLAAQEASADVPTRPDAAPEESLPESFKIRRPVLVARPAAAASNRLDEQVVRILGEGPFAVALRLEALARGATLEGEAAIVVDASADVADAFRLAQALDACRPTAWICATRLGADPSWVDPEVGMVHGARAGFAKALGKEWEGCRARVVDADPMLDDSAAASHIFDELSIDDGSVEVYTDGSQRRAVVLAAVDRPESGAQLRDHAVIVLTGGTRGITAQVGLELARRGPVRLALLARTAPGAAALDERVAKAAIKAEIEAGGDRATPARIDARLKPLRSAEEARRNVEAMQARGAEVRFYPVDMANEDQVRDCLEQVRADMSHIDGVVHGAGVEESRLLGDKTEADFARVFDGKARGGIALARNLERIAWFVSMGSVAGRFGNVGQVDYSAANEAMARVCLSRPRSLHVDWTAWADVGMAVRGGMGKLLTERGVEMLPAVPGAALLVDMVAAGLTGELLVAGRLGDLGDDGIHPLLDQIDVVGEVAVGTRVLDVETDPWIRDHSIDGTPVLPGVIGLELMAAVAAALKPGEPLVGAEDLRFDAPVKVHPGSPITLTIRAEPDDDGGVRCVLASERKARTGRILRTEHFSGTLRFGDPDLVSALPPAFYAEESLDREAIYSRFFHGPGFQVLEEAEAVFTQGLVARARVHHAFIAHGLLSAPLALEAAFQAAGLHGMAVDGTMGLPASFSTLRLDALPADGDELSVVVQRAGSRYDVDVDGPSGSVLRLRGFSLIETGPLPDPDRFTPPEGGWPKATLARAVADEPRGGPSALLPSEWAEIAARGTPRRQADRLAGRLAARRAVQALTGLEGEAFSLHSLPGGAPEVRMATGEPAPAISISHRDGRGYAVAVWRGRPGLDVEAVALRPKSFAQTWFTPAEAAASEGDPVHETELWCVKEAVLKALGVGMAIHPRLVEVERGPGGRAQVRLTGDARERWLALGGGSLVVQVGRLDGMVAAAALLDEGDRAAAPPVRRLA